MYKLKEISIYIYIYTHSVTINNNITINIALIHLAVCIAKEFFIDSQGEKI